MKISEIVTLLNAKIVCGEEFTDREIERAFASDLMSDVLTTPFDNGVLITGLANPQSVRTADMMDVSTIILARRKKATEEMISLAKENDAVIMECPLSVYHISGILYTHGLNPVY
jgi:serine kinase of HPr protein (carbohydrate metabolism regulator)